MKKYSGGNFIEWLLILVAISVVIFAIVVPGSIKKSLIGFSPFRISPIASSTNITESRTVTSERSRTNTTNNTGRTTIGSQTSGTVEASGLSIGSGNGPATYLPSDEYVTITNNGSVPVNITGYKLQNAKDTKLYALGKREVRYPADFAFIPQGTRVISPTSSHAMTDIILNPGEIAYVTTGSPMSRTPRLVSFKETKCTGYLADTYKLIPSLSRQCLRPDREAGVQNQTEQCQDFISSMRTCYTPKFGVVDSSGTRVDATGDECRDCVDGVELTEPCMNFIRNHYSYAGCLAYHGTDSDFEGKIWRIYLYKTWEMWASSEETVFLYDRQGNLVAKTSY